MNIPCIWKSSSYFADITGLYEFLYGGLYRASFINRIGFIVFHWKPTLVFVFRVENKEGIIQDTKKKEIEICGIRLVIFPV